LVYFDIRFGTFAVKRVGNTVPTLVALLTQLTSALFLRNHLRFCWMIKCLRREIKAKLEQQKVR